MSDQTLNRYLSRGDTADRTAFVPDPPTPASGPELTYLWWDTDLEALFVYDFVAVDWVPVSGGISSDIVSRTFTIDGGGSAITAGVINKFISIPEDCEIIGWTLMADQVGDVELDIFVDAPGVTYPPTTSIVAAAPPELSGVDFDSDSTLTGWTTPVSAGDVMGIEVVSATDIEELVLQIDFLVTS